MRMIYGKLLTITLSLFMFVLPVQAAETYHLDPSHSYAVWSINHLGFSIQYGKFAMVDGTLVLDKAQPQNSKVNALIHIDNLVTGVAKLDEHLKSPNFFNVAQFPTATFVSNKVELTGADTAKVYGAFTLHGVTKPLILDVKLLKSGMHPMKNVQSVGFTATATLKRSDYGMTAYLPMLGDEVALIIGTEANLATANSAN